MPYFDRILQDWVQAYQEIDRTINRSALDEMKQMVLAYFKMLAVERDVEPFYDRITAAAQRLSQMQVPFENLMIAFHLMEDSSLPYLKKVYPKKERLVEAMVAMDYVCHSCFSDIASSYFHEKYTKKAGAPQEELSQRHKLTSRELEVLKRIVDGYKNREIADLLRISIKTVEHHRASLMRKLGMHHVVDLIKFAIRNKIA